MFCTLLMPIFSLYLLCSLCFLWAVLRQLHFVLYLIDAYFLTLLTSIFLVFSVGSVLFIFALYCPSPMFSTSSTCFWSPLIFFILCMVSHHYLVSPSFSVGSAPVETPCIFLVFRQLRYILYLINAYCLSLLPCIFLVFSVGSVPAASLCHLPYRCLFSHHGVGVGRLSSWGCHLLQWRLQCLVHLRHQLELHDASPELAATGHLRHLLPTTRRTRRWVIQQEHTSVLPHQAPTQTG